MTLNSKHNLVYCFYLLVMSFSILLLPGILYAKQNPEIAALAIQQTHWTKTSFQKAEKKLVKIHIGMVGGEFLNAMGAQLFKDNQGRPITLAMDGFMLKLGENIKNTESNYIQTYVFGYVDERNMLHEKYFVVAKNDKIAEKIPLDNYGKFSPSELEATPTKSDYSKALEYVKNIRSGMWSGEMRRIMHMVGIWSGQNVNRGEVITSAEGGFFFFGPGYLRDKFDQEESEKDLIQQFVFGYEENGNIIPGFVIYLKNLQVVKVEYL